MDGNKLIPISIKFNEWCAVNLPDGRTIHVYPDGLVFANDASGINYAHYDFVDNYDGSVIVLPKDDDTL